MLPTGCCLCARADSLAPLPFCAPPHSQTAKFVGRLTLLDHGLLAKALELGAFSALPKLTGDKPEKSAAVVESAAVDEAALEKADADAETEEAFVARVEDFVRETLAEANKEQGGSSSRDAYKDDLVYNERKRVIGDFSKKGYKKCQSCKACVTLPLRPFRPLFARD